VKNDAANCGGCGKACPAGQSCSAGVCAVVCQGGSTLCNGACVQTASDPANCGACGKACSAGYACVTGNCLPLGGFLAHNIVDPAGNAYMNGFSSGIVYKVSPAGAVSTLNGAAPTGGFSMAFNPTNGTLYAITPWASPTTIYTVNTTTGVFTAWTNLGVEIGDSIDGMWFDPQGNMYINNGGATKVHKITPGGVISTFFSGAPLNGNITQGTCDAAGNVYVPSRSASQIVELSNAGAVIQTLTTSCPPWGVAVMTTGNLAYTCNGSTVYTLNLATKVNSTFATPGGTSLAYLSVDVGGNLWVGGWGSNTAYRLSPAGATLWSATIAGGSGAAF
jgi:streptogramin lyase